MRLTAIRGAVTLLSLLAATGVVAADLVAAIFFDAMRFDPDHPRALTSDRFVRSKGHAVPVLYAAWAEIGVIKREELYLGGGATRTGRFRGPITREGGTAERGGPLSRLCSAEIDMASTAVSVHFSSRD